jgi:hypothetical protein
VGRWPGTAGIARRRRLGWAAGGRRKEREGERLTGGPRSSAPREKKKKKKRRGEEWAGAGGLMGRLAIWAEREPALVFFFFLFLFQTSFSNIHFKFKQTFQTFSQKFYKLFRNLTSNQKPCKPTDDAQTLVVSKFIKLYLIF